MYFVATTKMNINEEKKQFDTFLKRKNVHLKTWRTMCDKSPNFVVVKKNLFTTYSRVKNTLNEVHMSSQLSQGGGTNF